jgi:hypothetical protein
MEFGFEGLDVYQKSLHLYQSLGGERAPAERCDSLRDLLRGVLELSQGIVMGASCWNREMKVRFWLNSLDRCRSLVPLLEGVVLDGAMEKAEREKARVEIETLCRMLASLVKRTRENGAARDEENRSPVATHSASSAA